MSGDLAALLARRLCHDFAGPTGAIGTALEMLGDGPDRELVLLGADSARALAAALELYRYVLTPSAADDGAGRARVLVEAWAGARGGPVIDWRDYGADWCPGMAQLVAGLAMLVAEATPHQQTVTIADGSASAAGAMLGTDMLLALAGEPATTTRASLPAVLAAQATAARLGIDASADPLRLGAYQSSRLPR